MAVLTPARWRICTMLSSWGGDDAWLHEAPCNLANTIIARVSDRVPSGLGFFELKLETEPGEGQL